MHATYPATIIFKSKKTAKSVISSLDTYCQMYNTAERELYVDWIIKKKDINQLKKDYQLKCAINARQFNSMRIELQGKVDSVLELNKAAIVDSESNIKKLKRDHSHHKVLLRNCLDAKTPDPENYKRNKISFTTLNNV